MNSYRPPVLYNMRGQRNRRRHNSVTMGVFTRYSQNIRTLTAVSNISKLCISINLYNKYILSDVFSLLIISYCQKQKQKFSGLMTSHTKASQYRIWIKIETASSKCFIFVMFVVFVNELRLASAGWTNRLNARRAVSVAITVMANNSSAAPAFRRWRFVLTSTLASFINVYYIIFAFGP